MNSRERLLRLFKGQETDRIPIWLLFPYHKVDYYADVYKLSSYKPLLSYIDEYCDTFDRRNYCKRHFCYNGNPDIKMQAAMREINHVSTEVYEVRYRDLVLNRYIGQTNSGKQIHYLVDNPEMLQRILEIPYGEVRVDFSPYRQEKEALGNRGLMMMDLGDPLAPLYHLCSAEDFAIWTLSDYASLLNFIKVMYERVYDLYKKYLENDIGEVFFIVGAEFAGPPLVSPDKFKDMSVQYLKKIVDLIRSYGKYSIIHYHGNLYKVLDGMKEINSDGLHTIEAPPVGDCTITQARERLDNMVLIGNIQYDDLRRLAPGEVDGMVRAMIKEAGDKRFILSPTAGPYEASIPESMINNYISFIQAGIKYGKK
jgi:uroporphyrinogen-III decarboxylase